MKKDLNRTGATLCSSMRPRSATTSWLNKFKLLALVVMTLLSINQVWGADVTAKWTAASGDLGSGIGSGTITDDKGNSWSYTRTLESGASYTGWTSNCIQLGKNGGVENLTISTSAITGTIKSVLVECSSYNNAHKVAISVGSTSYLSATATAKWTTVSSLGKSSGGTSSGTITISVTDGTRAFYIKSITVTYEEAASKKTVNFSGQKSGHFQPSFLALSQIVIWGFFAFFCKKVFHIRCTKGAFTLGSAYLYLPSTCYGDATELHIPFNIFSVYIFNLSKITFHF